MRFVLSAPQPTPESGTCSAIADLRRGPCGDAVGAARELWSAVSFGRCLRGAMLAVSLVGGVSGVASFSAPAEASAREPFSIEYSQRADARGRVAVSVRANENLSGVEITVAGSDGSKQRKQFGDLRAGKKVKVEWVQKKAEVHYTMALESESASGSFEFDVVRASAMGRAGALKIVSSAEELVVYHRVAFVAPHDLTSYQLEVFDLEGEQVVDRLVTDSPVSRGQKVSLDWDDDSDVFMVKVSGEDAAGRQSEYRVVPWSVEIPHTEVTFESGKWDIRPAQRPNLDEAFAVLVHELDRLERANTAVGGQIVAKLYIAGYTDTVGNAGDNATLSRNRARAIAQYFASRGAWCEIWYAGMGERGLAVPTADNVDEERNRRAVYILGVDPPGGSSLPASGAWKRLQSSRARALEDTPALPASYHDHQQKVRAERIAKRGGPAASTSSDNGGESVGSAEEADLGAERVNVARQDVDSSFDGLVGDEAEAGPPPVEGEPGASTRGCRSHADTAGVVPAIRALLGWRASR